MLIIINPSELSKFPIDEYDYSNEENPIFVKHADFKFELLAQNINTYQCCGEIIGDINKFKSSNIEYTEVEDIPKRYNQRCLLPQYGKYLNYKQIKKSKQISTLLEGKGLLDFKMNTEMATMLITLMMSEIDNLKSRIDILEGK